MPTVAELERLEALLSQLTPLTQVQRGEPVRAQDWNTVVGALIEVARAILAEERERIPLPHTHADQVTVGWLDPRLRTLMERGPLADLAAVARVAALERYVERLSNRIEDVDEGVRENRLRVTDFSTRDLVRESQVTAVRRSVEGTYDAREDVLALRETLRSIEDDVRVAVDVGSRLSVEGETVDMAAMEQRLRGLEEMKERLRTPSGELLDAATLEMRLTKLTNTLVTEEELDDVLKNRLGQAEPAGLAVLEEKLRAGLAESLNTSMTRLAEEIRGKTDKQLAEVDGVVARTVSDAMVGLTESVLASAQSEITTAVQGGMEQAQALFTKRLGELEEAMRGDFEQQLGAIQAEIGHAVQEEVARQFPTHLASVQADMVALSGRVAQVETASAGHATAMTEMATQMEVHARSTSKAQADMQRSLLDEMDSRQSAIQVALEEQRVQADATIKTRVDTAMADARRDLVTDVERIASQAASTEARLLANQLRGEMHAIAKDEAAVLQTQMRDIVTTEVGSAMTRLPGLVSQEVRRATVGLSEMVQTEFDAFKPTINQMVNQAFWDQGAGMVKAELERIIKSEPNLMTPPQTNFIDIVGIGPVFNERLKTANVRTFADLAALEPEALAGILGTTVSRVESYDIIGQAQLMADAK